MQNLPYRKNVAIIVFNPKGQVWLGKRIDDKGGNWQFPQGGVDKNEELEQAAMRELFEETSIINVEFLGSYAKALYYEFPKELQHLPIAQKYRGQEQYWFAYLFTGEDSEISIATEHPEFSAWYWEDFSKAIELVVSFKKASYKQAYDIFKKYELKLRGE